MDCFQDFCLHCDRDSPDGPYCSQQCKLADLEKANQSNPPSPSSTRGERSWNTTPYKVSSTTTHQRGTPGYDAPSSSSRPRSSYFMCHPSQRAPEQEERQLTPSSSRTSLSSTTSTSSLVAASGMTSQAKQQLQEYFSSFDQVKAAKRRSSLR